MPLTAPRGDCVSISLNPAAAADAATASAPGAVAGRSSGDVGDGATSHARNVPATMRALTTADINTPISRAPRPHSARDVLRTADIEGACVGWKPSHKQPRNPIDARYDVSDINRYLVHSHRDLFLGDQNAHGAAANAAAAAPTSSRGRAHARPVSAHPSTGRGGAGGSGLPPDFAYTGLPVFQGPPPSAEAWAASRAPAPVAPNEATAVAIARAAQSRLFREDDELTHAKWMQRMHNDAGITHRLYAERAAAKVAARAAASDAVDAMTVDGPAVSRLWDEMCAMDRTRAGRLTVFELSAAFDRAGIDCHAGDMAALADGLSDAAGLLPYQDLAKVLLAKARNPGSEPALFARRGRPATAHPVGRRGDGGGGVADGGNAVGSKRAADAAEAEGFVWARTASGGGMQDAACGTVPAELQAPPQQPHTTQADMAEVRAGPQPSPGPPAADASPCGSQGALLSALPGGGHNGGDGRVYYPYKSTSYWFGGASDAATLEQTAREWKPAGEPSAGPHPADSGDAVAAAASAPAARPASTGGVTHTRVSDRLTRPTASALLKSGELSPADLQAKLNQRPGSAAGSGRPWQHALFTASNAGAAGAVPTGRPQRSWSARAGGGGTGSGGRRTGTSYSSVAHTGGGMRMQALNEQLARHDVTAVRRLV
mmetsp:Transcript_44842/g.133912  ORF Transcript_44842/g.133912 Transcript_44842/m.133912 type:complete len:659 (-) Transcript_44842:1230-3206(-)